MSGVAGPPPTSPDGGGGPGTGAAGAASPRAPSRRRPSPALALVIGGALLLAVVLLVTNLTSGDPYETVLDAAATSLDVPVAADVAVDLDLGRLGELASAEGGGAAVGLGLLSGRVELDGRVTLASDTLLLELTGRGGGLASVRLDEGEAPLARLDADLVGELPGGRLLASAVPGLFGQGWVAIGTGDRFVPAPSTLSARLTELRDALRTGDAETVQRRWTIERAGRDEAGERFRVIASPADVDPPPPEAPDLHVWVDDGAISRVAVDALPFLRTELFGVALRGGDGGLELDLRPVPADVPPRPEPGGLLDTDALRGLLPF